MVILNGREIEKKYVIHAHEKRPNKNQSEWTKRPCASAYTSTDSVEKSI